ncbi:MAG: hypothetical protein V4574_04600 [Pseudomonadota bacterium]
MIAAAFVLVPMATFGTYFASYLLLHGDAFGGKIVGGHYFVGGKGQFTEVSRGTYIFSLWHGRVMIASYAALAVVGVAVQLWAWGKKGWRWVSGNFRQVQISGHDPREISVRRERSRCRSGGGRAGGREGGPADQP